MWDGSNECEMVGEWGKSRASWKDESRKEGNRHDGMKKGRRRRWRISELMDEGGGGGGFDEVKVAKGRPT
jgi:hypothetical protein